MTNSDIASGIHVASSGFQEIGALTDAVRQWDLDFMQLDRGPFHGRLFQLRWDGLQLQRASFGRALEQHGTAPGQMLTFGVPATPDFSILWRGHQVRGSNIMIFPPGGELYSVSRPGFDVFTFSVSESRLVDVATAAGLERAWHAARGHEVLACEDDAMDRLRSLLQRLTGPVETPRDQSSQPWTQEELRFELPRTLLASLGRVATDVPAARLRGVALRRAKQYIAEHPDESLRVSEVCRVSGVSERTLRYAFQERFGVGPKAYLAARQLNLVQRALRRADARSAGIAEIAGRYGFWHMGQFAADYRRQFGELPSATLGR